MGKAIIVDVARCSGCFNCQLACKDEHAGNDWTPYAKPQPDIGQFWCKLNEQVQGSIPKVKIHYIAELCNHCDKPSCIPACENDAIYKREDGFVIIDPEKCVGCGKCAEACPYGSVYRNEKLGICQKCTGCAHLLDNGTAVPRCVEACPTDALIFGEEEELKELLQGASVRNAELGCAPQVYYRNVPGQFVAGTVYDPEEEEVIEGARCRLQSGGKTWILDTDDFGDFWFKDLPEGRFSLVITAKGYKDINIEDISTLDNCASLGDIPMEKK